MAVDEDERALLTEVRGQAAIATRERFDHADAIALGEAALRAAETDDLPVAIRVMRGGQVAFHAARAGTTAEHDDWLRRKINSAVRHEIPTLELVLRHRVETRFPDWLDPREFAVAGGAVPIVVAGNVVGVIAVSGLTSSMRADHDVAVHALEATAEGRVAR